jgi:hypothetical protein
MGGYPGICPPVKHIANLKVELVGTNVQHVGVGRAVNRVRWCFLSFKNTAIHILTARFRNESIPLDTVFPKTECEK